MCVEKDFGLIRNVNRMSLHASSLDAPPKNRGEGRAV